MSSLLACDEIPRTFDVTAERLARPKMVNLGVLLGFLMIARIGQPIQKMLTWSDAQKVTCGLSKSISDLCYLSNSSEKFPDSCKKTKLKPLHKNVL